MKGFNHSVVGPHRATNNDGVDVDYRQNVKLFEQVYEGSIL